MSAPAVRHLLPNFHAVPTIHRRAIYMHLHLYHCQLTPYPVCLVCLLALLSCIAHPAGSRQQSQHPHRAVHSFTPASKPVLRSARPWLPTRRRRGDATLRDLLTAHRSVGPGLERRCGLLTTRTLTGEDANKCSGSVDEEGSCYGADGLLGVPRMSSPWA